MMLVDIGNTRVKLARGDARGVGATSAIALSDANLAEAVEAWAREALAAEASTRADGQPQHDVLIAAVAKPSIVAQIEAGFRAASPSVRVETVVSRAECAGLRIAYEDPTRLGVDRFLSMLGAWCDGFAPFVVASAGTALAIDTVAGDGAHLGGLIAPSPAAMRAAVLGATARVRVDAAGEIDDFGRSTEDGLESGCWHAAAALVDRAVQRAGRRFGATPAVLLGGGDASRLSPLVETPHTLRADLVMRGLWHYARLSRV